LTMTMTAFTKELGLKAFLKQVVNLNKASKSDSNCAVVMVIVISHGKKSHKSNI